MQIKRLNIVSQIFLKFIYTYNLEFKNSKILNSVKLDKNSLSDKDFELDVLVELPNKKRVIVRFGCLKLLAKQRVYQ